VEWLKNEDVKGFAKAMKEAEKQKFIRSMENVVTIDGCTDAVIVSKSDRFCSQMNEFIETYQILHTEVIDNAKQVEEKS
jgi:hypothetical protein